ncbi:uncharacterized protein LOC123652084 [Pipistrellus kuhlii]|uniref:uncharacterized protein LOC123652084 n=1 Tax=Pipistrellus kuhlii TaxID=59472 RepID=UPI001E26E8D4|nr:uncharacterized protein LOC123652084 [Pipistrellus kuhlii]
MALSATALSVTPRWGRRGGLCTGYLSLPGSWAWRVRSLGAGGRGGAEMLWSGGTAMDLLPPSDTQDSEHCFFCDSRDGDRGGHGIENVISWSGCHGNQTWWQAESGVENVTIQLDLESAFHFTHLVMTFKVTAAPAWRRAVCPLSSRPPVVLAPGNRGPLLSPDILPSGADPERSADRGRSWRVYRHFAHNCSGLPWRRSGPGRSASDLVCDQRYWDIEPSTEGKVRPRGGGEGGCEARGSGLLLPQVIFHVLDPALLVENPHDPEKQGNSSQACEAGGNREGSPAWGQLSHGPLVVPVLASMSAPRCPWHG